MSDASDFLDRVIKRDPPPGSNGGANAAPLPYVDMSRWDAEPAPPREWAVDDRIPMYQPHLTTGHGAIGKSLLELQRAVAHVLGKPWLGMLVRWGSVIYLGAEDEVDELQRRLEAILEHYGANFSDLIDGVLGFKLHLLSYVGEDCLLAAPERSGLIRPTELYGRLLADAVKLHPAAVIIDTLTDVYAGNEIDRVQTTQFLKLMTSMAVKARCSVSVLAHPSIQGMSSGSGFSGSTGWHNKVRSRLYMRAPTTERGEEVDSDLREIQFLKANYGKMAEAMTIRWVDGVFVPDVAGSMANEERNRSDEERFLALLAKNTQQDIPLSSKPTAPNYAPRRFTTELGSGDISQRRFKEAMDRLFDRGQIQMAPYGKSSRGTSKIALRSEP